jgi:hypothetical protein
MTYQPMFLLALSAPAGAQQRYGGEPCGANVVPDGRTGDGEPGQDEHRLDGVEPERWCHRRGLNPEQFGTCPDRGRHEPQYGHPQIRQ